MSNPEFFPLPDPTEQPKADSPSRDPHLNEEEFEEAIIAARNKRKGGHLKLVGGEGQEPDWKATDEERENGLRGVVVAKAALAENEPQPKHTQILRTPNANDFDEDGRLKPEYLKRAQ